MKPNIIYCNADVENIGSIYEISHQNLHVHVGTRRETLWIFGFVKKIGIFFIMILSVCFFSEVDFADQGPIAAVCLDCHSYMDKSFRINPHSKLDRKDLVENVCISCHGNADQHLSYGRDIFAFLGEDKPEEKLKKCLACHKNTGEAFKESMHGQAAFDCTKCHFIHQEEIQPSLLETKKDSLCTQCHEMDSIHMEKGNKQKIFSNIMICISCHNPHSQKIKE